MSGLMTPSIPAQNRDDVRVKLRAYLSAFWLRPENAMWMVLRSEALRRGGCHGFDLDLGCGDGVFSFLHLGGRLDPAFDVFTSLGEVGAHRSPKEDMFNHVDDRYYPIITRRSDSTIHTGTDHKSALLAKACRLNLYEQLTQVDHNTPLPVADGVFTSVYCNTAYWVESIDEFLSEIRRVTASSGRVYLHVKLDRMATTNLAAFESILGARVLGIIDAGRSRMWPTLADRTKWESRFQRAGFTVENAFPIANQSHAHLWDVGLRPLAPILAKMANSLDRRARRDIKKEWVDLFAELIEPLCEPDLDLFPGKAKPVEMQYELSPG